MSLTIQITQQNAKIGIDISKPRLQMQEQKADLEITQQRPQMTIDQGPGELEIDGEDARAALGHKPLVRFISDISHQVQQMVLQTIGDISEEGYELSDLRQHISIARLAKQKSQNTREPIEDVGPFSSTNVHISYTPHKTRIDWTPPKTTIDVTPHPAIIDYQPGDVSVYLAQKNWLHIDVKGNYLNREL